MRQPRSGDVYDAGGALAVYWPDVHPCHIPTGRPQWVILHIDGAAEIRDEDPRPVAEMKHLGTIPGILPGGAYLEHEPCT
jgi:hypothetical protein